MSRRVNNPQADRAAQNQQTIKALLKLEGNKVCADCKKNKHPRWASWNIGVFVCIRCSGIHRGMGTHISRVKSVDLDSWTDEQLQSVLKWGNSRANKYWEAKLAAGHMPSEAKIENFIRTKYESKRWVMDGSMPDPASLDAEGDDDVPLNLVQEQAKIERSASQRVASAPQQPQPQQGRQSTSNIDLFGDDALNTPVRPNTVGVPDTKPATGGGPALPRRAKQGESLLGLDFFGGTQSTGSERPSSAASNPTSSRPDLKQSILSLYASAPKPQPPPQPSHPRQPSFGGMSSPPTTNSDPFSGSSDAFAGLSFPSTTTTRSPPQGPGQAAFASLGGLSSTIPPKAALSAPQIASGPPLSGGNFFDSVPTKPSSQAKARVTSPSNGLDFSFAQPSFSSPPPQKTSTSNDLFAADDFDAFASATPVPPPVPPPTKVSSPAPKPIADFSSAFNLSSPSAPVPRPVTTASRPPVVAPTSSAMFDPWSSGNETSAWDAPDSAPAKSPAAAVDIGKPPSRITPNDISGGWGAPISSSGNTKPNQTPTVTADEDFGGWTSASTTQTPVAGPMKPGGGFTNASDPFDNPWG